MSETWLTVDILDAQIYLQGYKLIRHDRLTEKKGGGVAFYFRESFIMQTLAESTNQHPNSTEFLSISLSATNHHKIALCVAYRPNKHCDSTYLEEHISNIHQSSLNFVLIGDLNANLLSSYPDAIDLLELSSSLSLLSTLLCYSSHAHVKYLD